jgi:flagellar FliL protein
MGKLAIALFMTSVIVGECVFAYVMFPDPKEIARHAMEKIQDDLRVKKKDEDSDEGNDEEAKSLEVKLGDFDITAFQAASNTSVRISFNLFATLNESDESNFEDLKAEYEQRLRDKIIFEIRNADVSDLTDPGLGLIKRRILEKSNLLFGKSILKSVVFGNFAFVEQ